MDEISFWVSKPFLMMNALRIKDKIIQIAIMFCKSNKCEIKKREIMAEAI